MDSSKTVLGISTGSLYPAADRVEQVFAFAESARLDGVEVICDRQRETHDLDHLRSLSERHGVPVVSLHSPFPGAAPEEWGASMEEILNRSAKLAADLGARHVVVHLPERFYFRSIGSLRLPAVSRLGRELFELMGRDGLQAVEERFGVLVCVENMPRQFRLVSDRWLYHWNSVEEWARTHRHLTLDTTHWGTKGVAPLAAFDAGGDAVRHIHLANYASREEHLPPQYGSLDLSALLKRVAGDEQRRVVIIELAAEHLPEDPIARMMTLRQAVAFCRSYIP